MTFMFMLLVMPVKWAFPYRTSYIYAAAVLTSILPGLGTFQIIRVHVDQGDADEFPVLIFLNRSPTVSWLMMGRERTRGGVRGPETPQPL